MGWVSDNEWDGWEATMDWTAIGGNECGGRVVATMNSRVARQCMMGSSGEGNDVGSGDGDNEQGDEQQLMERSGSGGKRTEKSSPAKVGGEQST